MLMLPLLLASGEDDEVDRREGSSLLDLAFVSMLVLLLLLPYGDVEEDCEVDDVEPGSSFRRRFLYLRSS